MILYRIIGHTLTTSLIKYYSLSKAYKYINGICSSIFVTTIGVKQGVQLSPRLFSLYIESIIEYIDNSGLGIKIGSMIINILLYADDIILLANDLNEMQKMLDIVARIGADLQVKFNSSKTNFLTINMHLKKNKLRHANKWL